MSTKRRANRREFLKGKAAVEALEDAASGWGDSAALDDWPASQPASYLIRLARRAMACQFETYLNAGQYHHGAEIALAAFDLVDQLEDQLTVYREQSEVSQINRRAAHEPVAVEPRLFALLALAAEIHRETAGAYDITAGPLSRVWGFTHRTGAIPSEAALVDARQCVGNQHLQFDAEQGTLRYLAPGVEINLGSIGKGYALDRAAELFAAADIHDVLLHGGHSSVLALGSCGSTPGGGWIVGVRNPLRPQRRLGEIRLCNRALATSGSGTQFFFHQGRRYGHILDPRTGWPADQVLSATVLAPTAALADALSTAFYVLGPELAAAYCQTHPEISAILLTPDDHSGRKHSAAVKVHTLGLAAHEWSMPNGDDQP